MTREYNTTYAEEKVREWNNNAGRACTLWKCRSLDPDWTLTYGDKHSHETHLASFGTRERAEHAAAHYMATGQMPEITNTERSRA